jgi:hypothetical protein
MKDINEIIDFINLTGEKCVIIHQEKGAYVVLKLEDYKNLHQDKVKREQAQNLTMPDTNPRLYEIPRLETEQDIYYPEPLD